MILTNKHKIPDSVAAALSDQYKPKGTPETRLSVTQLINPPRITQLQYRHFDEIEEDVSDRLWALLGSSVHYVLDKAEAVDSLKEEKIEIMVDGCLIVGKFDLYDSVKKSLEDYKVTSVWSYIYSKDGKREWEEQLNIYAWLLRMCGFEVKQLKINAILRDWVKSKAKSDPDYPQIPFQVINIKLWSEEDQEKFIKERVAIHKEASGDTDDFLPECTKDERWTRNDSFAIYKGENKRALRVFDSELDARVFQKKYEEDNPKIKTRFEIRKGQDIRCQDYCSVNKWCSYYQDKYETK